MSKLKESFKKRAELHKDDMVTCKKCNYIWVKHTDRPVRCPNCRCYEWDTYGDKDVNL